MFRRKNPQQIATDILSQKLLALTGSVKKEAKGLRLGQGTVLVTVSNVDLWQKGKVWFANSMITFALNEERPDSYITDSNVGIGESENEAITSALETWLRLVAPPVFSLLLNKPSYEADYHPANHPLGIPSWASFSSPYVLKGKEEPTAIMSKYLSENPLITLIVKALPTSFDKPALNTIKLYLGFSGVDYHGDCYVNGVPQPNIAQILADIRVPNLSNYVSVSQYYLLLQREGTISFQ